MAFTPRTSKYSPSNLTWDGSVTESNKWWYSLSYNAGANDTYCLPNCTTYAKGRTSEISGSAKNFLGRGATGFRDAEWWYNDATWERGDTPKLGAIACFQAENTVGHVAVVEATDGTLANTYLSYSGYVLPRTGERSFTNPGESASTYFMYTSYETMLSNYETWGYPLTLDGFIYNPDVTPGPGPEPTTTYRLTYDVSPANSGYITGSPQGDYEEGTEITISANANTGYIFDKWVGVGEDYRQTISKVMNKDRHYTAYFKSNVFNIILYNSIVNRRKTNGKSTYIYI